MTALDIAEARWVGNTSNPPGVAVPLHPVVNLEVDLETKPAIWAGMLIQSQETRDITMGSTPWVMETGILVVGLFAKSGEGPHVLDAAVAAVRSAFHGWKSNGLRITNVNGPVDLEPGAEGNWWRLGLDMPYEYLYRRANTGPGFDTMQGLAA